MTRLLVLALVLAACGDDATTPDAGAGPADAGIDGAPGAISITVFTIDDFGEPPIDPTEAGVPVVLVGPDGTEDVRATDDDGQVDAIIAPGTTVFVLQHPPFGAAPVLSIFVGVDPGIELLIGRPRPSPFSPTNLGFALIDLPPVTDAFTYDAQASCSPFGASSTEPQLFADVVQCARVDHATVVTRAFDGDVRLLAYGVLRGVDLPLALGESISVPADRLPAGATIAYSSVPPEVTAITVVQTQHVDDVAVPTMPMARAPDGSVLTFQVPVVGAADRTSVTTTLNGDGGALGTVVNLRRFRESRLITHLDLGATMVPFMTVPTINMNARTAAWTLVGGSGRQPALVAMRGFYQTEFTTISYTLIGPGDHTHLTWPRFPDALPEVAPAFASFGSVGEYYGVTAVGGDYAALVPTADGELRQAIGRDDVLPAVDDLWITGRGL